MNARQDPHDGWTPEPQEQVQPGDPWRDPAEEGMVRDLRAARSLPVALDNPQTGLLREALDDIARSITALFGAAGQGQAAHSRALEAALASVRAALALAQVPHTDCGEKCACWTRGHEEGFRDGHD